MNNAGIYEFDPLENVTEHEFHREFNTNVLGPILTTQEALKLLRARRRQRDQHQLGRQHLRTAELGRLFGDQGRRRRRSRACWRRSSAPRKIRVNTIAPGGVETEGTHSIGVIGSDFEKQIIAGTPLGRFGQPEDIASVAVFLASDAARWLTGERIAASGGFR